MESINADGRSCNRRSSLRVGVVTLVITSTLPRHTNGLLSRYTGLHRIGVCAVSSFLSSLLRTGRATCGSSPFAYTLQAVVVLRGPTHTVVNTTAYRPGGQYGMPFRHTSSLIYDIESWSNFRLMMCDILNLFPNRHEVRCLHFQFKQQRSDDWIGAKIQKS